MRAVAPLACIPQMDDIDLAYWPSDWQLNILSLAGPLQLPLPVVADISENVL